jgi:hypothetical protein
MFLLVYIFEFVGAFVIWTLIGFKGYLDEIIENKRILCQVVSGLIVVSIIALTIYL